METYILVHRHPHNYTSTPKTVAAWQAWFQQLGDAIVDIGNPVLGGRGIAGTATSALPLGGYTLIAADNFDVAQRLANACPILNEGGAVEIGRLTPVPGRHHPARTF